MSTVKQGPPRSRADIAHDIVLALDGGKEAPLKLSESETRANVLLVIENSNKFFGQWDHRLSRRVRAAVAKSAQKIAELVAGLEAELKGAPEPLADYLFGPPISRNRLLPKDFPIVEETSAQKLEFLKRLARLRLDCRRSQEPPPESDGPEYDREKQHCATLALNVVKTYSNKLPKSTAESAYPVVASLLFEALTRESEVTLKRACDRVLKAEKKESERQEKESERRRTPKD